MYLLIKKIPSLIIIYRNFLVKFELRVKKNKQALLVKYIGIHIKTVQIYGILFYKMIRK